MRRPTRTLAPAATVLLLIPALASAQERPQTREGFYIGFGLGAGSLGCEDCDSREWGVSGYLQLGGTLNDQVLLGFESNGWTKEEGSARLTSSNASAVVTFYPNPESGFHIKGGIGVATLKLDVSSFGGSTTGVGFVAGAGHDVRSGDNFSITPFANITVGSFDGGTMNMLQLGLGLTWH